MELSPVETSRWVEVARDTLDDSRGNFDDVGLSWRERRVRTKGVNRGRSTRTLVSEEGMRRVISGTYV